jgi:DNA-binding phage protein
MVIGRPRAISDARLQEMRQALAAGMSKARVCRVYGVKRTTLYDALSREE